jgi:hypothetical protein
LCSNLLHKCFVGPSVRERPHVLEVSWREAFHFRKGLLQICRQAVNNLSTPTFPLLANEDFSADPPIEKHQLAVDRNRRSQLRFADALLEFLQQRGVGVG